MKLPMKPKEPKKYLFGGTTLQVVGQVGAGLGSELRKLSKSEIIVFLRITIVTLEPESKVRKTRTPTTRSYPILGRNQITGPQLPPRAGFFSSKWPLGMPRGGGASNPGLFGLDGAPGGHFACFWLYFV